MSTIILHAPEDTHLVRPLQRFLELSGLECECRDTPPRELRSDNILVICGDTLDANQWLMDILRQSPAAVLVQITPPMNPIEHGTVIDLHNWPSRSADKTLVTLAEWLQQGRLDSFSPRPAASPTPASREWLRENAAPMILLGVVALILVSLLSFEQPMSAAITPSLPREQDAWSNGSQVLQNRSAHDLASQSARSGADVASTAPPRDTGSKTTKASVADTSASPATVIRCMQDFGFGCAVLNCEPIHQ
jgi:hypothetical protein